MCAAAACCATATFSACTAAAALAARASLDCSTIAAAGLSRVDSPVVGLA